VVEVQVQLGVDPRKPAQKTVISIP
jgi:hypothetical protein